jgi:hypothetical protein
MLKFTEEEKETVIDYYLSQSKDASVTFAQKVYAESVIGHTHYIWDLHANDGRWWICGHQTETNKHSMKMQFSANKTFERNVWAVT